jgi:ABC-type transport system substrate-binding protein
MRSIPTRCELPAAVGLFAIMTASGCSEHLAAPIPAQHDDVAPARHGGTLRLASFADVRTLDPAGPLDGLAGEAIHLIFAGLVDYDHQANVVPDLADHWDVDDGGRTYRFTLRQGVVMHDGAELTADDVKRSVERSLHPSTPNPNASYFVGIAGYDAYAAKKAAHLSGVEVDGPYVVSFRLTAPDATFLPLLAMPTLRPTCRSATDRYVDTWLPCGAGPFKLEPKGWQRGTSLRLVRHAGYFLTGLPYLDAVEWTYDMQSLAQRFRFEDGQLDMIRDLTQADLTRFLADERWKPYGVAESDTSIFGESMNTRMPPFDKVEVRRAVAAAIDREHYRVLKPANMSPLSQVIPSAVPGYDPTFRGQRYDYPAALEHMRKAGYAFDPSTGRGGWPAPVAYLLYDQGVVLYTAQVLQQELAKIGIRLELKVVSWPAFLAMRTEPDRAGMSLGSWSMDYPDPSTFFEPLFGSASLAGESTYSSAFYSNPALDDLLLRAHREGDSSLRNRLYREANEIVCLDAPWAFTFGYHWFDVRQPYVRGFTPHPVWGRDVSRVWIDRTSAEVQK